MVLGIDPNTNFVYSLWGRGKWFFPRPRWLFLRGVI